MVRARACRIWLCVVVGVVGICVVGSVKANAPGPRANPAVASHPTGGEGPLEVEREVVKLECGKLFKKPRCRFQATYYLRNESDEQVSTRTVFVGGRARKVRLVYRGDGTSRALSATETETLAAERIEELRTRFGKWVSMGAAASRPAAGARVPDIKAYGRGIEFEVPAGGEGRLVMKGHLKPGYLVPAGYGAVQRPGKLRHSWLGPPLRDRAHLRYFLAPIRTWAGDPEVDVRLEVPRGWQVAAPGKVEATPVEGGGKRFEWTVDPSQREWLRVEVRPTLPFRSRSDSPRIRGEGVVVGFGGYLDDTEGVVGRLGLQGSVGHVFLPSLFVESNFRGRWLVTPTVQVASPMFWVVPSLGVGGGPVFEVAPNRRAGMRVQTSVHFPVVGLSTHVDWFPGYGGGDWRQLQVGMMLQVGF